MSYTLPTTNRSILLAAYPKAKPTLDDFKLVELPLSESELKQGEVCDALLPMNNFNTPPLQLLYVNNHVVHIHQVLLRTEWISVDPALRGRMRGPEFKSYVPGFHVGQPIVSRIVARVVASQDHTHKLGDLVQGITQQVELLSDALHYIDLFAKTCHYNVLRFAAMARV